MPKYWGKQIFTLEIPRSGSKAKDGERKTERCYNNGQLRIANATSGGARKAAWANKKHLYATTSFSYGAKWLQMMCSMFMLQFQTSATATMTKYDFRFCQISCNLGMMGGWG